MNQSKKKRKSLSLRLQPYEGDVLAEVVDYLNNCFEYMYEGQVFECNVLICLCCCHLIKNIV